MCNTIHYEFLLKIQPYIHKMRTILSLILIDFLRSRLSDFYTNFIEMVYFFYQRLKNAHISLDLSSYPSKVHLNSPDYWSD